MVNRRRLACFLTPLCWMPPAAAAGAADRGTPLTARVQVVEGTPTLFVNGQPHNPLMFWGSPHSSRGPAPVRVGPPWQRFTTSFDAFETQPNTALHIRMGGQANRVRVRNVSFAEADHPDRNLVRNSAFAGDWTQDWSLFVRTDRGAQAAARPEGSALYVEMAAGGNDPMYVHLYQRGHSITAGRRYTFSAELQAEQPQTLELLVVQAGGDWTPYTPGQGGPVLEEIRLAARAGVHIHSFGVPLPWSQGSSEPKYEAVDPCLDAVLQADPDALLLPRFMMDSPPDWKARHPTEVMLYDDGSPGQASVASEIWRKDAEITLRRFVEHIESRYGQRVIGYHPCGQHTGEWFYDGSWVPRVSGFEPAFVEGFRRFVRERYGHDVSALRRAWRDESATFDSAAVPTADDRARASVGVFRDPATEGRLIDFNEYLQIAMVEPLERFARTIKEATGGRKLVVLFYGYLFEIAALRRGPQASGHLAMHRLLRCPDVDILCSPISYGDRGLIGSTPFMAAVDSVGLHGKLWLNEDDTRTHLASPDDPYSRLATPEQTQWVHLRNFGPLLTRRITCWWMDLPGEGWLKSPEIWSTLRELKKQYDRDLGRPGRYKPQIAVIVDEKSLFHLAGGNVLTSPLLYHLREPINRIGAPVGLYLLSDLVAGRVPEARLYLFPNAFALTGTERAALARILHRDGKVAVWMYGAGFIRETADVDHMSALLRMTLQQGMKPQSLAVRWGDGSDPLLEGLRGQSLDVPGQPVPVFTVAEPADGCRVLGRFAAGGRAAVAVRASPGCTTVYAGTLTLPSAFLRQCARQAGVFLYAETDDVVQTDGRWLVLSATSAGARQVRWPRPANIRDAMTGRAVGQGIDRWTVDMQAGETRIFQAD